MVCLLHGHASSATPRDHPPWPGLEEGRPEKFGTGLRPRGGRPAPTKRPARSVAGQARSARGSHFSPSGQGRCSMAVPERSAARGHRLRPIPTGIPKHASSRSRPGFHSAPSTWSRASARDPCPQVPRFEQAPKGDRTPNKSRRNNGWADAGSGVSAATPSAPGRAPGRSGCPAMRRGGTGRAYRTFRLPSVVQTVRRPCRRVPCS